MCKGINGATLSLRCLEVLLALWVGSLVRLSEKVKREKESYVLSRTSSTSATCWRSAHFAVGSLGMLLLHMSVERGIAKIRLVTIFALVISAVNIILGSALSLVLVIAPAFII